ncbi:hypothetical protein M0P98_09500 [bacterium]|nr:hypothetical protein [bacterium]
MRIELELLKIIEQQKGLMQKKDELIKNLVNKNVELEELVRELMKKH